MCFSACLLEGVSHGVCWKGRERVVGGDGGVGVGGGGGCMCICFEGQQLSTALSLQKKRWKRIL